jgi:hypothetical protein
MECCAMERLLRKLCCAVTAKKIQTTQVTGFRCSRSPGLCASRAESGQALSTKQKQCCTNSRCVGHSSDAKSTESSRIVLRQVTHKI